MRCFHIILASLMANSAYAGLAARSSNTHSDIKSPEPEPETFNGYAGQPPNIRPSIEPGAKNTIDPTLHEIGQQTGSASTLHRRQKSSAKVLCHVQNLQPVPRESIVTLQKWQYSLATGQNSAPWSCTQVACKYNTGVWLCNDNMWQVTVNSITISYHMNDILDEEGCTTSGNHDSIQGQAFSNDNYNVIVGWDPCLQEIPEEDINLGKNIAYTPQTRVISVKKLTISQSKSSALLLGWYWDFTLHISV
ncbi:hypothetical protein F4818DRAFT_456300 [Hypoxylon cercidicola]|nr:hypothetical protein F4818DRAFT_456300 [Hypoxylon cercidicola]